jgi:hypothetical protein
MSEQKIGRKLPTLHLGLALTFGLALFIGLLLATTFVRPPDVPPAQARPVSPYANRTGQASETAVASSTLTSTLWLPLIIEYRPPPSIEFTYVPPWGSSGYLRGSVQSVAPSEYRVAVYIYVGGWYNKPYWDSPLTSIGDDGSWKTNITTVETDKQATIIAAFLVPKGYDGPPELHGDPVLPCELFEDSVAHTYVERARRVLHFSGYDWNVKYSAENRVAPGPNYFSDAEQDVWVDESDQLHLRIARRDGKWYTTEVFTQAPLGYGKYVFYLASRVDQLDKNVVLGLFTWETVSPCGYHNREIDIEFAKWGVEGGDNAQYVVQPCEPHELLLELSGDDSTHGLEWRPDRAYFQTIQGHRAFPVPEADALESWEYEGSCIPPAGIGNARINLWLYDSLTPSDGNEVEVVIERFEFLP